MDLIIAIVVLVGFPILVTVVQDYRRRRIPAEEPDIDRIIREGKAIISLQVRLDRERVERHRAKLEALLVQHLNALRVSRRQLITTNRYGVGDRAAWDREVGLFLRTIVIPGCPELTDRGKLSDHVEHWIRVAIDHLLDEEDANGASDTTVANVEQMSPLEFERYCADELERVGWTTRLTSASGDQGIDIIAERAGVKLVVQCKRYQRDVGNGAVQEIVAGQVYEHADVAAVVTTSSFTPAARSLAAAAGVRLIHRTEIGML